MSPDLVFPIISSLGWLILCGVALVSHQLKWSQMVKMALVWLAVFVGFFLIVEWFLVARDTASHLL